jgi:hypothetical protein
MPNQYVVCFQCGEIGHYPGDYPNPRKVQQYIPLCGNCKEAGHPTTECTQPQEKKTPQYDPYMSKHKFVIAWSFHVVKASQFKILFVGKIRTKKQHTWATLTRWEVVLVRNLGEDINVIFENSIVQNYHMFMHKLYEPFNLVYVKESYVEPDNINFGVHLHK